MIRKIFVFVLCFILGFFAINQLEYINRKTYENTYEEKNSLISEYEELLQENNSLNLKLQEKTTQLDNIKKKQLLEDNNAKQLEEDIIKYKMLLGMLDVKGEGIVINIKPTNHQSEDISSDNQDFIEIILSIINKLNSSGAEAISINDTRYTNESFFTQENNNLMFNSKILNFPVIIKAIGDSNGMYSALNMKYGVIWEIKRSYDIDMSVEKKEQVYIKKIG